MAKVIGYDQSMMKRFTCHQCTAIVEYCKQDIYWNGQRDEGAKITGVACPGCGEFNREEWFPKEQRLYY